MKTLLMSLMVWSFFPFMLVAQSDSLGLPGDNLSLYGVLETFRKSESVEAFEKSLNAESNHVNNLDLNGDGQVDYLMVNEQASGDAHILVLSVQLAEDDIRDLACVAIEKTASDEAHIQVLGDEEYYGPDYIIEPTDEMAPGGKGGYVGAGLVVNVWGWSCVRWVFRPGYVVWVSPWRWMNPPLWWRPWRPWAWNTWRPACQPYVHLHVRTHRIHVVSANDLYRKNRQARARADRSIQGKRGVNRDQVHDRDQNRKSGSSGDKSAKPRHEKSKRNAAKDAKNDRSGQPRHRGSGKRAGS